ncbi:hypothetical protein V5799_002214 [Amblyomma americanum]|uniref:Uncharacterized protein n=1 Tax=Amblyomma americanum TaxID=6943 RepID=A0AAQ4CXZ3_AMBAM
MDAEATPGHLPPALLATSFTALNWTQHDVCNGELTVIVLLGGPSVKRVSGGTVPRILAEPYLDIQMQKMDAEVTPGHLPPALLATRMVYTCRPHH